MYRPALVACDYMRRRMQEYLYSNSSANMFNEEEYMPYMVERCDIHSKPIVYESHGDRY